MIFYSESREKVIIENRLASRWIFREMTGGLCNVCVESNESLCYAKETKEDSYDEPTELKR